MKWMWVTIAAALFFALVAFVTGDEAFRLSPRFVVVFIANGLLNPLTWAVGAYSFYRWRRGF